VWILPLKYTASTVIRSFSPENASAPPANAHSVRIVKYAKGKRFTDSPENQR